VLSEVKERPLEKGVIHVFSLGGSMAGATRKQELETARPRAVRLVGRAASRGARARRLQNKKRGRSRVSWQSYRATRAQRLTASKICLRCI
jgi:hypothetical protein